MLEFLFDFVFPFIKENIVEKVVWGTGGVYWLDFYYINLGC